MGYTPPQISGEATAIGAITGLGAGVKDGVLVRPIFDTRAAAASTTTLLVGDASTQEITTGSATHIFKTPVVTTLVAGWATLFVNVSTATVTLNSSGNNLIATLAPGQSVTLKCRSISADTTAAAWDVVGLSPRLWLAATNVLHELVSSAAATYMSWSGAIGNMTGALSGTTFTAPTTGKYTFRTLLQYLSASDISDVSEINFTVKLTTSGGTLIQTLRSGGVNYISDPKAAGAETLEWTLSLTAGDTVKVELYYTDDGDGTNLNFAASSCQLKITQEL